jgi:hypothetical protein
VAEVLVSFTKPTRSATGDLYYARALGQVADDGLWEGWLEFTRAGDDETVTTRRETEQPNRSDLMYWAQGLTQTYLEGALERALAPEPVRVSTATGPELVESSPRGSSIPAAALSNRVVLDPFATYTEGEQLLRSQLRALSHDHLQNIVEAYQFVDAAEPDWPRMASKHALAERIIERVRSRFQAGASRPTGAAAGEQPRAET